MPADEKRDTFLVTLRIYKPEKSREEMVRCLTPTSKETQLVQAILSTKSHYEIISFSLFNLNLFFFTNILKMYRYDHFSPLVLDLFSICKYGTQKGFITCPKSKITVTCIVPTILFNDKREWLMNSFMVPQSLSTSLFNFRHAALN